ncbi:MAG TPA: glycosyltransferase family 2 protein [Polyangia bacterium]|nr:glycosyltransferase family 2 protein [Polyangia bacterium]
MKLSIIIPVYNEAKTVGAVIDKVRSLDLGSDITKEIIVVNDGSSDGTREALARWETIDGVRVHHSPVNLGKGSSVRIGFSFASGDIITIQDADLELDPSEYEHLIKPIVDGSADVVYGSRFVGKGRQGKLSFWIANKALATLTNVLYGAELTDIETCYKVLRADVVKQLKLKAARFEIEPELTAQLLKHGFRIRELPIGYAPRTHDEGKKINWKDGFGAVWMLVTQRLDK